MAIIIRHEESAGLEMMRLLLGQGADPLLPNNKGLTPMHHAAGRGNIDMIDLIFAAAPAALNVGAGKGGITPLGLAVELVVLSNREREGIVGHLLSLGATDKGVPVKEASALVKAAGQQGNEVSRHISPSFPCTYFLHMHMCFYVCNEHMLLSTLQRPHKPLNSPPPQYTPQNTRRGCKTDAAAHVWTLPCFCACLAGGGTLAARRSGGAKSGEVLGRGSAFLRRRRGSRGRAREDRQDARDGRGRRPATALGEGPPERHAGPFSAASRGSIPTVAVLLAAGADEQARDDDGHRASDFAGMSLPTDEINAASKTSAVKRTLERAPAFRARSWAWAAEVVSPQGRGAAGATAGGLRELSTAPAGVRIFRPRNQRFFTTRFNR